MKVTGIIAEYNPFHRGHQYHLAQAVRKTGADAVIVVMSGNFVQRGTGAVADKYTRAQAALLCGADLVLELPVLYSAASAEYFAGGAIALLESTGVVENVAFGSESSNTDMLLELAKLLADEPEDYKLALKKHLQAGNSFPKARELALQNCIFCPDTTLLSQPNNILALEYCKQLYRRKSSIQPVFIRREGGAYHQAQQDELFSSATRIRTQLSEHLSVDAVAAQLPKQTLPLLKNAYQKTFPVFDEDFSAYVHFALLRVPGHDYTPYLDVNEELSNRIRSSLYDYTCFHAFVQKLKTKELTYSRICRCLLHIMLDMRKDMYETALKQTLIPYIRILGMGEKGSILLRHMRAKTSLDFVTNASGAAKLTGTASSMFALDCHAADVWNGIAADKFHHPLPNEFQRKFLKV